MVQILDCPTRYYFFTGKGGVGKTSLACATAIALADSGKRVLLVSTDPASNLDQVLGVTLGPEPTPIPSVAGLAALNIDPQAAAAAYRDRVLAPLRGQITPEEMQGREEELAGACTVEIAAFDEFTALLTHAAYRSRFEHIIFDTAPTGHTLRLLHLPAAWSTFLDENPRGASCLGPHSALTQQQSQYAEAVAALGDAAQSTLVLVTRPERGALREAARAAADLQALGMDNQHLIVNGVFTATNRLDRVAVALERRGIDALSAMPTALEWLPSSRVPLRARNLVGIDTLRAMFDDTQLADVDAPPLVRVDSPPLTSIVDDLARTDHGLILVMGKGGVGKTTIAAAVAVELAARGHDVHLTTTDPAAHLASTIEGAVDHLQVSRIDPAVETAAYVERVLASRGRGMSASELDLLREDLASPCTEEVAVFHAFSRVVSQARRGFVVVDTAPTGHTLLLLDATGAYHQEVMNSLSQRTGLTGAVTPLMRIRDSDYTHVLLVALPETTPVLEAAELQDDLRRAGIEPYAWVVNSSLAATGTTDPLLRRRAADEREQMALVARYSTRTVVVPWQAEEPVGVQRLRALAAGAVAAEDALVAGD